MVKNNQKFKFQEILDFETILTGQEQDGCLNNLISQSQKTYS